MVSCAVAAVRTLRAEGKRDDVRIIGEFERPRFEIVWDVLVLSRA
jgi:hypothetical protein